MMITLTKWLKRILTVGLILTASMSCLNFTLFVVFQIPVMLPPFSFSAMRIAFFAPVSWVHAVVSLLLILFLFCSPIFVYKESKIMMIVLGAYMVFDTGWVAGLFLRDLIGQYYFDNMYFALLLWYGALLTTQIGLWVIQKKKHKKDQKINTIGNNCLSHD